MGEAPDGASLWHSVVDGIVGIPKNGKGREMPLGEDVLRVLKAFRRLHDPVVFCAEDGRMLTKGWQVLRHTFASHLAMKGVALEVIQERARPRRSLHARRGRRASSRRMSGG